MCMENLDQGPKYRSDTESSVLKNEPKILPYRPTEFFQ